jgi:ABC-2 type transport system ATP-binding protein
VVSNDKPNETIWAIEARGLVKRFDGFVAVDGVDLSVPQGAIYGILGPNGAGKTTTLRMLQGIIDPDAGVRRILGADRPHDVAHRIGYLPEERGLYPTMKTYEAIAFMGALRGLPLAEGRRRGKAMMEEHGLGYAIDRQIRQLSKGMAQQVQILGTLVHNPDLVIFDEPFSGLDALNQGKLEKMIRALAAGGTTVIFSTHVIAHAERLCDEVAIIAGGRVPFAGPVDVARDRIPAQVRLETRHHDGPWRAALPADARHEHKGPSGSSPCPTAGSNLCCAP